MPSGSTIAICPASRGSLRPVVLSRISIGPPGLLVNAPTTVVSVCSSYRTNRAEPRTPAEALGVSIVVRPCPGLISNSTVPFVKRKFRVPGTKRKTAISPTRAQEPSLKRSPTREDLIVWSASSGRIISDNTASRAGCPLGTN